MPTQAVVVIHGMGEQLPMDTLLSFVNTAWANDPALVDPGKPDPNTGGLRGACVYTVDFDHSKGVRVPEPYLRRA